MMYPKSTHVKLKPAAYRKFAEKVMERDGWCCKICGTTQGLTVSHIIHRGMGGRHGPGDVMSNVHTLCVQCHMDNPGWDNK